MESRGKRLVIAGISGAVGGILGAVCGSNSLLVVAVVAAVSAVLVAWIINGMVK